MCFQENIVRDGSEQPVVAHLGQRLDFLTKELVRLEEERRVAAYVMLAERERRIREAEESGRRQREERIRRTEDEMFKQMMRVHQGTVDTYLQDIILKSVDRTADEEARKEIAEKAKTINRLAHDFKYSYVICLFCWTRLKLNDSVLGNCLGRNWWQKWFILSFFPK